MAKKGTYNGPFFNNFVDRLHGTPIKFGVLIGTEADEGQRDIVFAAPTPPQPVGDEGEAPAAAKDVSALLKSKSDGTPFTDWASEHAFAVKKLLPGGIEPCGCFAVATEAAAKDLAPLLAPVLRQMADPFVLTIDPQSKKLSFWQYSGGPKPALRPGQLKADSHKDAVLLLCATPIDLAVPRSDGEASAEALSAEVSRSLAKALEGCIVGVGADASPVSVVDFGSEAPLSSVAPASCRELRAHFFHGGTILAGPSGQGRSMRQRSLVVASGLFLRRSLELRHAVEMLRKGLVASAAERLQLALDEADAPEQEAWCEAAAEGAAKGKGRSKGLLQLPWRALCCPEECELPLWCGDYCMPDEEISAARERLSQLLGTPEESLREAPAHLSEQLRLGRDFKGTYDAAAAAAASSAGKPSGSGQAKGPNVPALACAAAVGVLLLAAAIPMLSG